MTQTTSHPTTTTQPSHLLLLPRDLRNQIYSYILSTTPISIQTLKYDETTWWTTHVFNAAKRGPNREQYLILYQSYWKTRRTGLFTVCQQLSNEALDYFYGTNVFIIDLINGGGGGGGDKLDKFLQIGTANLCRIRFLRIIAREQQQRGLAAGTATSCYRSYILRPIPLALWQPLLLGLEWLEVVVRPPSLSAVGEKGFGKWKGWLLHYLRVVGFYVKGGTEVRIDDGGVEEVGGLMRFWLDCGRGDGVV